MLRRHRQGGRAHEGGFKLQHQQEVLNFLCTRANRLKEITPRMAWKLAMARRHDLDYETAWDDQLEPQVIHHGLILPEKIPLLISPAMRRSTEPPPIVPDLDPTPSIPDPAPHPDPDPPPPAASLPSGS